MSIVGFMNKALLGKRLIRQYQSHFPLVIDSN